MKRKAGIATIAAAKTEHQFVADPTIEVKPAIKPHVAIYWPSIGPLKFFAIAIDLTAIPGVP